MIQDLLTAIALILILEGILPFLSPRTLRKALFSIVQNNDKQLRITGFLTMLVGLILLYWVR
ncbi:MAG: DUF2065 domain-containing protein [Spiribacter sp.]|nr:DUF2065 domain-containing protein [Spiribacter sp.]MDR9489086.1 DUF2065 domain-containing protein [Spiribacter sp.]